MHLWLSEGLESSSLGLCFFLCQIRVLGKVVPNTFWQPSLPWALTAVDTWPPPGGLRTWGLSPGFPAIESAEGRRQRADLWGWQQLWCRRLWRKQSSGACVGKHSDCHRKESILSSCSLEIFKLVNSHCQCTQQLDPGCPHFTLEELPYSLSEKWLHGGSQASWLPAPPNWRDLGVSLWELGGALQCPGEEPCGQIAKPKALSCSSALASFWPEVSSGHID